MTKLMRTQQDSREGRTRIVFVRQPIRSVRSGEEPGPLPVRLAIGVIVASGALAALWMIGYVGCALGFAAMIHLPGLKTTPLDGLITAALIIANTPALIMRLGINDPLGLMVGFALITIPAACLAAARPATPGGPAPHPLTRAFSILTVIGGGLQLAAILGWLLSPQRAALISPMPTEAAALAPWLAVLQRAAAIDLFAVTIAAVWTVLLMRLAVPFWQQALCVPVAIVTIVFSATGMAMTNATVAQILVPRSVATLPGDESGVQAALLGQVADRTAVLIRQGDRFETRLLDPAASLTIRGSRPIIELAVDETEAARLR